MNFHKNLVTDFKKLPNTPGVYLFLDKDKNILYVGKAIKLKQRVKAYFDLKILSSSLKTKRMVQNACNINFILVNTEIEALILENDLIKRYKPLL